MIEDYEFDNFNDKKAFINGRIVSYDIAVPATINYTPDEDSYEYIGVGEIYSVNGWTQQPSPTSTPESRKKKFYKKNIGY